MYLMTENNAEELVKKKTPQTSKSQGALLSSEILLKCLEYLVLVNH